jgi:transcriptional regulator with XRE-family HTH domain
VPRTPQTFGAKLAAIRVSRGYTQQEVAERIDLSRSHLGNLERDRTNGSTPGLARLYEFYELTDEERLELRRLFAKKPPLMRPRLRPHH